MGEGKKITLVILSVIFLSQLCWTETEVLYVNHYTSTYGLLCYDTCRMHENMYHWCNTKAGWDYCSILENTDYKGYDCKDDHPCEKHGKNYYWCYTQDGTSNYCGKVELKTVRYISSTYQSVCINECSNDESNKYYWCNTEKGWDYCSPKNNVTYKNKACRLDHPCDPHGYGYTWCRTDSGWDYCGLVKVKQNNSTTGRHKRQPNNNLV